MCYYRRLVYGTCNHDRWLFTTPVSLCGKEKDFNEGLIDVGCDKMFSHGRHTLKIQKRCPECTERKESLDRTFEELKRGIKVLKADLAWRLNRPPTPPPGEMMEGREIKAEGEVGEKDEEGKPEDDESMEKAEAEVRTAE